MKQHLRTAITVAILVFGVHVHGYAQGGCDTGGGGCVSVPEIDPSMATGAVVLLGGAMMLIRSRATK